ncbi:MAG: hypothetical protein HQM10_25455 [Candidatus Riflebacteria bacterium]|nr:hypothetical protein [Candidatus Riflebacteria bacterium]
MKKLQLDREKQIAAQKEEADKKRMVIIAASVVTVIALVIVFVFILMKKTAEREYQAARAKLYEHKVSDFGGAAFCRSIGDWEPMKKGMVFNTDYTFKTEKDGFITIALYMQNQVKLGSTSEMVVFKPQLHEKENRVLKERVVVNRGEITVSISMEGRDLLDVEAPGVVSIGASGLYKMIYNDVKRTGEVVVKHGLVEVLNKKGEAGGNQKRVKVSGFYKVTFANFEITNPTQASVIQYDWR